MGTTREEEMSKEQYEEAMKEIGDFYEYGKIPKEEAIKTVIKALEQERNIGSVYQKGLDDAWECAKKIACREAGGGIPWCDMQKIFVDFSAGVSAIFENNSASEAMQKIKEYEEEKKKSRKEKSRRRVPSRR